MFLNFATTSFIATLLSFAASVTAHPTANLIRELKDSPGLADSNQGFAGAILNESTNYDLVTSNFVIPEFRPANLTADSCTIRIFAFVGFSINPNGTVQVFAQAPIPPVVSFNARDIARITVEVSDNGYNGTVENLTTGRAAKGYMPSVIPPVCTAASWGIEGPNSQSFVGSINFYNTFARHDRKHGGLEVGPRGATIRNIVTPNGTNLTYTNITSASEIAISYL
ncbi:uncharacterized protein EI90DRAFT_3032110 [Cantharellus anzutake]|uniref:uncharacterized protein n=1 Tax=Cantharellus anzutake TaxID=1750568 RepID=UPI0019087FFA|nr:uncharacterized protein EI90DRAFT_3032110 [Cantharellus anzutake]KAF8342092.1 hypothetical protein EI90DRAFT_3032110 [Cantharellus anzutake]